MQILLPLGLLALGLFTGTAADARIHRDRSEVRAFQKAKPCPATGLSRGRCDGWQVDHITPLCAGGADHRSNMQWLAVDDHKWKTFLDVRACRKARQAEPPDANS